MQYQKSLAWFRRDLRDFDHAALYHALKNSAQVYCAFVFDTDILDNLANKADRRVEFIWESVRELKTALQIKGGDLIVLHGRAVDEIPTLANTLQVQAVFTNHDYEPSAIARDTQVASQLQTSNIVFHHYKDQVIFEKDEVLTMADKPYSVFTPYKNRWLNTVNDFYLNTYTVDAYLHHLAKPQTNNLITLKALGFQRTNLSGMRLPTGMSGGAALFTDFVARIQRYKEARDFPAVKGVSYLSVHLRFGTVSIRHLARTALQIGGAGAETWASELIWRDFYFQILHHHPQLAVGKAFKQAFETLPFPNNPDYFKAWCDGKTGYPLVDAAMRQLNSTGFMHNRLRMVAASFLVKDLLIDWRWGERYFAEKLMDFDFSANNGGWQWAASTGCDAQPWFRIFNPITQSERFDANGRFIRKYVTELANCNDKEIHAPWLIPPLRQSAINLVIGRDYPKPIVDHAEQRSMALTLYQMNG
ncbi:MAG: deoxyribodipyrimidine photo-lyase [Methylotenera sp.]|nr:deoxyribodipyrimidine photo-lyase [Methylotenera sp.]MDP1754268.1 deoxyribodipyrimidine photo-lyase [Methylotenera sp.]MDP1959770.1 deoxyribodipyrimidine photo-lyase [Methylotenera sp.]MDP3303247.1 deoxyribodipyrimidine photo-lyase [Methylotenera sp.]MDP3942606.1 deoxyribodipyrimidine photo-lyase [Methylotenera sp.]